MLTWPCAQTDRCSPKKTKKEKKCSIYAMNVLNTPHDSRFDVTKNYPYKANINMFWFISTIGYIKSLLCTYQIVLRSWWNSVQRLLVCCSSFFFQKAILLSFHCLYSMLALKEHSKQSRVSHPLWIPSSTTVKQSNSKKKEAGWFANNDSYFHAPEEAMTGN